MHHEVSTLKCTISNHYALLVITDLERHFDFNTPRKYRDFKCLLEKTTVCKLFFLLNHRLLVDTCNICCPEKNCHAEQKIAVLINSRFEKKKFRKRDKLHLLLINNPTEEKKSNYKTQCELVNRLMRDTKRKYYDRKINLQSNAKSLFNAFKEFSGKILRLVVKLILMISTTLLCKLVKALQPIYLVILDLQTQKQIKNLFYFVQLMSQKFLLL